MTAVYDSEGNEIGHFDGSFVYDRVGEKRYWINDGEVFSMPSISREYELGPSAAIKMAVFNGTTAVDTEGATVFTL